MQIPDDNNFRLRLYLHSLSQKVKRLTSCSTSSHVLILNAEKERNKLENSITKWKSGPCTESKMFSVLKVQYIHVSKVQSHCTNKLLFYSLLSLSVRSWVAIDLVLSSHLFSLHSVGPWLPIFWGRIHILLRIDKLYLEFSSDACSPIHEKWCSVKVCFPLLSLVYNFQLGVLRRRELFSRFKLIQTLYRNRKQKYRRSFLFLHLVPIVRCMSVLLTYIYI